MNYKNIPIFIISYNRLSYLSLLINYLEKSGYENIHIVDNNSSYPPLLEYLHSSKHCVHFLKKNFKHRAVWTSGCFKSIIRKQYYVVTDCDVLPVETCPDNFIEYFFEVLKKYKEITKVGFSLKIDDIPQCYNQKNKVIDWESRFWTMVKAPGLYESIIDTTFALYRPGISPESKKWWKSIRTDDPYLARHLPWYEDSSKISEEEKYYQKEIDFMVSDWTIIDSDVIHEKYKKLLIEYKLLTKKYNNLKKNYISIPNPLKLIIYQKIIAQIIKKIHNRKESNNTH